MTHPGERPFARASLRMFAGILIWAAHFAAIYGYTAIACARGFGAQAITIGVGVATLVAALAALAMLLPAWSQRTRFEDALTAGVAALALVAIVYEGLTVLIVVPACA